MSKVYMTPLRLAAFVAPQVPLAAVSVLLYVNLPPFYATEMGLGLVTVSQVFFFARLWDVLLDPTFGWVSDQLRPRWGRRRPWIVISLPILVATVYLLFLPKPGVSASQLFSTLFIFYVGWTLATLSFFAWGSELTNDYDGRSKVQGWYQFAVVGGISALLTLLAVIERTGGTRADQLAAMGIVGVVLMPITFLAAVTFMGERDVPPHEPITVGAAFGAFRVNKPLRFVLVAAILAHVSLGLIGSLFVFFAKDFLGLGNYSSTLLLGYFVAGVIGIPIWTRLAMRVGKHRCFVYQAIYNIAALSVLFVLPRGELWIAALAFIAVGFNYGTADVLLRAMMSDVIDVDRLETGHDRSGLFFALVTLSAKFGAAAPLIIFYPILAAIGFKTRGENSPQAIDGLAAMYVLTPILCNIGVMLLMRLFPMDRARHAELQQELSSRAAARAR
jgi:glycoside/pentoside/hexuronide:cation symporter, GPH family